MSENLTNLATVKAWLASTSPGAPVNTADDALLLRLIRAASTFVLNYTGRSSFVPHDVTDVEDGGGNSWMVLRQWPVLSVASVAFYGVTINTPATGNPRTSGYYLQDPPPAGANQRLDLYGWCFPNGRGNVTVTYRVGYVTNAEPAIVPIAPGPYTVTTFEFWVADLGVTLENGTALTKVTGAPAALQYAVSATGVYTFNAAQAGATVLISYAYIPADIVQAVTELVGERYKARTRIGVNSQSLAGKESITYYQRADMSAWMTSALQPYRRVI